MYFSIMQTQFTVMMSMEMSTEIVWSYWSFKENAFISSVLTDDMYTGKLIIQKKISIEL